MGGTARQPAYVWCFLAALVLNVFSGQTEHLGLPLPVGPDRAFFGAGALLLLLDHRPWARHRLRWRPVHAAMAALLGLALLSALFAGTLTTPLGLFALLDRLVVPFFLFCLGPVVFDTERRRDLLLRTLVLLGLYLGVTAFGEMVGPRWIVVPRYVVDESVGIQFGRARGPFVGSEAMGMACAMCGMAAGFAATRFRGWWRAVSLLTAALTAFAVLLTLTRSVWLGAALGVVLGMLAVPGLRRKLPVVLAGLVAGVVLLLAVVPGLSESVTERAGTVRSVNDRQNTNAAALRIVEQHPLTGVGWVRFLDVSTDYVRQAEDYPVTNVTIEVHNVVLGRAAELGLPGAAAFVGCIALGLGTAALRRRGTPGDLEGWHVVSIGASAVWFTAIMLSPVPYPLPNALVWLLAGIALSTHLAEPRSRREQRGT
ncbi:O-antigen ligase family protein [Kineococcus indalonis]|uniref:O-antigen ligase family protein n=1 Tax=Kineococcus indalonis TaxID=2696566 RepID=UPI00196B58DC|nr:O-antigen ligase family protein [Kineococcus indalonis]NAZ87601.1 hypothetical protein [Kineococcus indalonis]